MSMLTGIAAGDELRTFYGLRSKSADEKTISASSAEALELKLSGEQKDGWEVVRRNKSSIRLSLPKPSDRQLEDDVWSMLYRMGFKELNKDRQFLIECGQGAPARQFDVFAKDDETVFIVECTHAKEGGTKSVKSLIDKICAVRDDVLKAVHSHFGKDPKLKVKIAIATRNIAVNAADKARALASGIPLINEDDIVYFEKLTVLLKGAARYQFLSRYFRNEKVEGLRSKVPATRGRIGEVTFYNFLISPYELLRLSYISHKSKTSNDDLETYQRMVKPSRLAAIGAFLDGGGTFPTNIVVNFKVNQPMEFQAREKFGDTATGTLTLPALYGSAWVIDGQHRLFGYSHVTRDEDSDHSVVSVLAYENLSTRDEIQMFVDINTKQVKVSGNLVKEILSTLDFFDTDPRKRLDALYARVTLRLDDSPGSPVKNRILTVSQDKSNYRCLTLTSLADGIAENKLLGTVHKSGNTSIWAPGALAEVSCDPEKTMEKASDALARYLSIFANGVPDHWQLGDAKGGYLCTNLGVRALLLVLGKVLGFLETKEGLKFFSLPAEQVIELVEPYVAPLVTYFSAASDQDVAAFRGRGSSLLSVSQNALQMLSIMYEANPQFSLPEVIVYMNSRDIEGTKEAKDLIDEVNLIIYEDVVSELKKHHGETKDAWWFKGVPVAVRDSCDLNYNKSDGNHDRWQFLFLSNYPDILLHGDNWNLFEQHYNFYGKGKKATLPRWIGRLNKARTVTHHAEKGPLSKDDVEYVRAVHKLVKKHVEGKEPVPGGNLLAELESKTDATTAAQATN